MLTHEAPEVYLKRRRLARDYFLQVPEGKVDECSRFLGDLRSWLGIARDDDDFSATRCKEVDGPDCKDLTLSDKTLALRRLDRLIAEAEAACAASSDAPGKGRRPRSRK